MVVWLFAYISISTANGSKRVLRFTIVQGQQNLFSFNGRMFNLIWMWKWQLFFFLIPHPICTFEWKYQHDFVIICIAMLSHQIVFKFIVSTGTVINLCVNWFVYLIFVESFNFLKCKTLNWTNINHHVDDRSTHINVVCCDTYQYLWLRLNWQWIQLIIKYSLSSAKDSRLLFAQLQLNDKTLKNGCPP